MKATFGREVTSLACYVQYQRLMLAVLSLHMLVPILTERYIKTTPLSSCRYSIESEYVVSSA